MIAVVVRDAERAAVQEFFELFKTPWMFYDMEEDCDVLLCAGAELPKNRAKLVLVYAGEACCVDHEYNIQSHAQSPDRLFSYHGGQIPVYGNAVTFGASSSPVLEDKLSREPAVTSINKAGQTLVRIGYDLFREIQILLVQGQAAARAAVPALEHHIDLLRTLILEHGVPLVEIPPVPEGRKFIACLTHDVDHFGLRNHRFDHTMFGFLSRASVGSVLEVCRGRKSMRQFFTNWMAALSLPLVHLGLVRDFWASFDRYLQIEDGLPSTFFVIPKKDEAGLDAQGRIRAKRAARYDVGSLTTELRKLKAAGREIGVHGIDAWRDSARGTSERQRMCQFTGDLDVGVRMHWLYFDEHSPLALERAGFVYDSTLGYNETVGYRAGTTQVFKPFETLRLLELPMHVMDTALFYPSYLNLSPKQAESVIREMVKNSVRLGGVLTVNWHDRSVFPERLWDEFYINLLGILRSSGAWFASATQAVAWFAKRRAASFERVSGTNGALRIRSVSESTESLPGLLLRVYRHIGGSWEKTDSPVQGDAQISLAV